MNFELPETSYSRFLMPQNAQMYKNLFLSQCCSKHKLSRLPLLDKTVKGTEEIWAWSCLICKHLSPFKTSLIKLVFLTGKTFIHVGLIMQKINFQAGHREILLTCPFLQKNLPSCDLSLFFLYVPRGLEVKNKLKNIFSLCFTWNSDDELVLKPQKI